MSAEVRNCLIEALIRMQRFERNHFFGEKQVLKVELKQN